ncbi:MAG TPA: dephospho-CoA kinase [Alphaproteobacteria bacterium]|nr:dephospho-CoA kinase [Alphaproteobacteria bacterium]
MIVLGVTGSIGSGKSYFCKKFSAKKGVKFVSSDTMVHDLYAHNNQVLEFIKHNFTEALIENKIDRKMLGKIVFNDKKRRKILENFIYPLLKKKRKKQMDIYRRNGLKILVLEIPLLFENELQEECDYTLTVFCNKFIQEQRALKRAGFTRENFMRVLATQMNVQKKIRLSDFSVNSGRNISGRLNDIYFQLISK